MPMYSRPGKIISILKKKSVQLMKPVSREVPPLRLAPPNMMTSKAPPPHLFVHPSLINRKIMARHHVYFPLTFCQAITCSLAKLTPHVAIDTPTDTFYIVASPKV